MQTNTLRKKNGTRTNIKKFSEVKRGWGVESNTEEANLECIQVLMGPRLSAAWQANRNTNGNRQDFMECSELQVNSMALTREQTREQGQEHR